jgi:pimeloyl-ACP methyl ester carboxylesterase
VDGAIETRELITVTVGGISLRGTYHRSQDDRSGAGPGLGARNRIAVLFLNSGFHPRASTGDAAVYWADSFSRCGYPSFRFDLQGLGDSDQDVPAKFLEFISVGGYAPSVSRIVEELVERYGLSGVVIMGLCAGAVSAAYAAAACQHVKGLVALDPYFFAEEPERPKIRNEISLWARRNKLGGQLRKVYSRLKKFRIFLSLRGNALPRNANVPLIRCWSRLASAGVPMLILNADPPRSAREFDYLGYLRALAGPGSRIALKFVERAKHSFADDVGRAAVRRHTEQWLGACFPRIE